MTENWSSSSSPQTVNFADGVKRIRIQYSYAAYDPANHMDIDEA